MVTTVSGFRTAKEDILSIMKTLELDEDVTSVRTASGQKVFVKRRAGALM